MQLTSMCSGATAVVRAQHTRGAARHARQCAARPWLALTSLPRRAAACAVAAAEGSSSVEPEASEECEGLLPEEDQQVPGHYRDAMTSNTPLGKAVKGACDELDTLGDLERQTLEQAEGLLKQLGYKGSLFTEPQQQQQEAEAEGESS